MKLQTGGGGSDTTAVQFSGPTCDVLPDDEIQMQEVVKDVHLLGELGPEVPYLLSRQLSTDQASPVVRMEREIKTPIYIIVGLKMER